MTCEEDVLDSPLFHDILILKTVDEKERLDKVRAYEEKHGLEILYILGILNYLQ